MDNMTAKNMAKGLNVYRDGPTGAAMRVLKQHSGGEFSQTTTSAPTKALPPLRLRGVGKAKSK